MIASALALAAVLSASAPDGSRVIAYDRPETKTHWPDLTVGSGSFPTGGAISMQQSGYGKNLAPSLRWTAGPQNTVTYVVIVEDADATAPDGKRPLLHWLVYEIPPGVRELTSKTKNLARVADDDLAFLQGVNDHGGLGWTGPHPPVGDPPHHYHFQVFAVDYKALDQPGAKVEGLLKQMNGHVLAKGQIVALYEQRPDPVRKPRKGGAPPAAEASPSPPAP